MSGERLVTEQQRGAEDQRSSFETDRDRLLYATSFARLAEVTQVISADHGYVFHNRLTHSLKVAQVARRLAENCLRSQKEAVEKAGGLDADATEAAGLAHDLGHPPFGHIAEDELNDCMKDIAKDDGFETDGFEGNAQSFRLVTSLTVGDAVNASSKAPIMMGLNLTRRTLNGILKYPWIAGFEGRKKCGAYRSEREFFDFARQNFPFGATTKSLEAELMDWADDITYAVHDVVDFYCAGKIPLERFAEKNEFELKRFFDEVFARKGNEKLKNREDDYKSAFIRVCDQVYRQSIRSRYGGTAKERSDIWQMMTLLITRYVSGIKVIDVPVQNNSLVIIDKSKEDEIAMLKQLTWHYVIVRTDLATIQHGQKHMVREVLRTLFEASRKNTTLFAPPFDQLVRDAKGPDGKLRLVVDYVSGMTEMELIRTYQKLFGQKIAPLHPY